jgi:RNA recognition motif-containing protein
MGRKIIVENLPADITEKRLMDIFSQIGSVEAVKIQTDLLTRRPRGSGYVKMSLDLDAYRAVNCLNGATFRDREIYVQEAKTFYERAVQTLLSRISNMKRQREQKWRNGQIN